MYQVHKNMSILKQKLKLQSRDSFKYINKEISKIGVELDLIEVIIQIEVRSYEIAT